MPRDYRETIRALRAKANDPVVPAPEREALLAKAQELEDKHVPVKSQPTEPTITDRSGQSATADFEDILRWWRDDYAQRQQHAGFGTRAGKSYYEQHQRERYEEARRQTEDLFRRQQAWNRPPQEPDEDTIISEEYKGNEFDYEKGDPYDD